MKKMVVIFLLLTFLIPLTTQPLSADDSAAWQIHEKSWFAILNDRSPESKYSIYANRVLSVKHPEIYLKGDLEMFQEIFSLYPELALHFSWDHLQNIEARREKQSYREGLPYFDFIDRRILPPTATLRMQYRGESLKKKKMSFLEKAFLAFFLKKKEDKSPPLSILYCASSDAYLLYNDTAVYMSDMKEYALNDVSCDPVMIISEDDSWFPLMGKKSTSKTIKDKLSKINRAFSAESLLSDKERKLVEILRNKTALDGSEVAIAELLSQKRGPIVTVDYEYVVNDDMLSRWERSFHYGENDEMNIGRIHTGASHLIMQSVNVLGNQLSPVSAYLADMSACDSTVPDCLAGKYGKHFLWYLLWSWGLTSQSIDESYSSGGTGVCAEQATHMASVLEVMGIDYYVLHLTGVNKEGRKKDHRVVYVPGWNVTFSNNEMFAGYKEPSGYKGLVYIYHDGRWLFFGGSSTFGNDNKKGAGKVLADFIALVEQKGLHNEFSCQTFTNEADFDTCTTFSTDFPKSNYKQITFKTSTSLAYQSLLLEK